MLSQVLSSLKIVNPIFERRFKMEDNRYEFVVTIDVNTDIPYITAKDLLNRALRGAHGLDVVAIDPETASIKKRRIEGPVTRLIRRCV
jgi:hypothetical protein